MPSRCPTVSNVSRAVVLTVEALAPAGCAATIERDGADAALPRPGAGAETLDVPTANTSSSAWEEVFSAMTQRQVEAIAADVIEQIESGQVA